MRCDTVAVVNVTQPGPRATNEGYPRLRMLRPLA